MAEKVTLRHPGTGRTVATDNAEAISNLRYGRGFQVVAAPRTPATPPHVAAAAEEPSGATGDETPGTAPRVRR